MVVELRAGDAGGWLGSKLKFMVLLRPSLRHMAALCLSPEADLLFNQSIR